MRLVSVLAMVLVVSLNLASVKSSPAPGHYIHEYYRNQEETQGSLDNFPQ